MSVQAQYPSNVIFSDFRKRLRSETPDELSVKENLIQLYNSGLNSAPQLPGSVPYNAEGNANTSSPGLRKKLREYMNFSNRNLQQATFVPVTANLDTRNLVNPAINLQQQVVPTCINGLQFSSGRFPQPTVSAACKDAVYAPVSSSAIVNSSGNSMANTNYNDFQLQYAKQKDDIDQLIALHGEQLKQALEEKRQAHTRALLAFVDQSISVRLREKDLEIEKLNRRNQELEDHVKQLILESRLWQNVARNSEVMVTSLRSNLEQVVALSREQSKEGCGETDADDAESCIHGNDEDIHANAGRDHHENANQRKCRSCRKNNGCVLLLPCRHLCLCKDCDTWTNSCPICGAAKNASLQVFMD